MILRLYKIIFLIYTLTVIVGPWLISYLTAIIFTIKSSRKEIIFNIISRFVSKKFVQFLGVKVKVNGAENIPIDEPVIFVSNHQSFFDIALAFAFVPNNFSFISKESVFHVPLVGRFMKTSGHISLKREAGKKAYETMVETIDKLNSGKSLVIFPEGTRSVDGKLGPLKRGISLIISQSGKRVIPMAIIGSGKFFPRDGFTCDPRNRDIKVKFGKPLLFEKRVKSTREDANKIVESIRESISELILDKS